MLLSIQMRNCLLCCFISFLLSCNSDQPKSAKFILLSPELSGIDFVNRISESDTINLFDYYYIYNGSGVAVGDLNNDDLPDLFFGANMVSSKFYLNKGSFHFQDVTNLSGLTTNSWVMGVTLVDVNSDDLLDIYLCVAGPSIMDNTMENLLFINTGPDDTGIPHFVESAKEYGINDGYFSVQSVFLDYDVDGDLDLFVLTNEVNNIDKTFVVENGNAVTKGKTVDHLYENIGIVDSLGHPFFIKRDTSCGITDEGYGLGLGVDDFNGDNFPDIYVANDFMPDDKLYINQGDGMFKEMGSDFLPTQSYNGMGVDIADVNGDLLPDIMVLDMLPDNNNRRKSMIAGMKHQAFQLRKDKNYQAQYLRNTLHLNMGTDQKDALYFTDIGQLAGVHATDWSWGPLFADFDNDGDRDLFITNGFVKDMTDLDYINYRASQSYFGTKEAKKDREKIMMDGLTEVKISNYLFENRGALRFNNITSKCGINNPSFSNGAIYADLDLDGDLDIVTNEINATALVYENVSPGNNNYLTIELHGEGLNAQAIGAKVLAITDQSKI